MKNIFTNFEEYFLLFPKEVQVKLELLRKTIHEQIADLEEYIGYQMPAFRYKKKQLVYFAAYKNHIGFYPASDGIKFFEKDFIERKYKFSKGAVQFPLNEALPLDLVERMVKFKISEIDLLK
ncbi:hypothetical protein ASG31_03510 [Chryseobacterium sp. Leaf404]|uniref:iron chaperone n=1 Tax=unclassified Chryseobacterium TaxID=2593645 RepID=UPI0006F59E19|nr:MULTISPECIES: DUF1801 domain-containing protein [unclassified Chryseobacterium]KQT22405.1 hypothetical protein ASG31_03510 [Chryseobacterium sp. Leaf404]